MEKEFNFVYITTNLINGKQYVGDHSTNNLNHNKSKNFLGSGRLFVKKVKQYGRENFTRTILMLCKSKGACSYWEAYHQFKNHAIIEDSYYNDWIQCKIHRKHLKPK